MHSHNNRSEMQLGAETNRLNEHEQDLNKSKKYKKKM
jgi:hypothetical protein